MLQFFIELLDLRFFLSLSTDKRDILCFSDLFQPDLELQQLQWRAAVDLYDRIV